MVPVIYKGFDNCHRCECVKATWMFPGRFIYCFNCVNDYTEFRWNSDKGDWVAISEPLFQLTGMTEEQYDNYLQAVHEHESPGNHPDSSKDIPWAPEDTLYSVLDHGFIRLVDHMGNDASIVQAARVSTGQGTKTPEQDAKLIDYLMRNAHTSPFEAVTLKVHVKCPIFVARQWMRHRTWSYNEVSARYTEMPEEFYIPEAANIKQQDVTNRQGGSERLNWVDAGSAEHEINITCQECYEAYRRLLGLGVSREQARMVLPVALYTEFYATVNLHNLFNFLRLRLDPHAQWEIRQYAEVLHEIARVIAPVATESFDKYILQRI